MSNWARGVCGDGCLSDCGFHRCDVERHVRQRRLKIQEEARLACASQHKVSNAQNSRYNERPFYNVGQVAGEIAAMAFLQLMSLRAGQHAAWSPMSGEDDTLFLCAQYALDACGMPNYLDESVELVFRGDHAYRDIVDQARACARMSSGHALLDQDSSNCIESARENLVNIVDHAVVETSGIENTNDVVAAAIPQQANASYSCTSLAAPCNCTLLGGGHAKQREGTLHVNLNVFKEWCNSHDPPRLPRQIPKRSDDDDQCL